MADLNKNKLKNLPADERIKKLKELIETHEKELKEAKELVSASEQELVEDQVKNEEQWRQQQPLEQTIDEEEVTKQAEIEATQQAQYITRETPTYYLGSVAAAIISSGEISAEQVSTLQYIGTAVREKMEDVERGAYSATREVVAELSALAKIGKTLSVYKR